VNSLIEDAVIANLVATFPSPIIYTGKVVEGVQPDDIIVNTVLDNVQTFRGVKIRQRNVFIQVTVINPTQDSTVVADMLVSCLQAIDASGTIHYPTSININRDDDKVQALANLVYMETTN
jgi:hypothetical protein